jgi:transcriptional regulator with XRE-family HTH domain
MGGVKKNAQMNYERGARVPSAEYLSNIAQAGVDVMFVLMGPQRLPAPESASDYALDPATIALLPAEIIQSTMDSLHLMLWKTAAAIAEIEELTHPDQPQSASHIIREHLRCTPERMLTQEFVSINALTARLRQVEYGENSYT